MKKKKLYTDEKIYVVICQMNSGAWSIADFWHNLPYASTSLKKIREYKQNIADLACDIDCEDWNEKRFSIKKMKELIYVKNIRKI